MANKISEAQIMIDETNKLLDDYYKDSQNAYPTIPQIPTLYDPNTHGPLPEQDSLFEMDMSSSKLVEAAQELYNYVTGAKEGQISADAEARLKEAGITEDTIKDISSTEELIIKILPTLAAAGMNAADFLVSIGLDVLAATPHLLEAIVKGTVNIAQFVWDNKDIITSIAGRLAPMLIEWYVNNKLLDSKTVYMESLATPLSVIKQLIGSKNFDSLLDGMKAIVDASSIAKDVDYGVARTVLNHSTKYTHNDVEWTLHPMGNIVVAYPNKNVQGLDVQVFKIKPSKLQAIATPIVSKVPYGGGALMAFIEYFMNLDDNKEIKNALEKASEPETITDMLLKLFNGVTKGHVESFVRDKFVRPKEDTQDDTSQSEMLPSSVSETSKPSAADAISVVTKPNNKSEAISPDLMGLFDAINLASISGGNDPLFNYSSRGRKSKKR